MKNVSVAVLLPSTGRAKQMTKRVADLVSQPLPDGVDVTFYLAVPEDDKQTLKAAEKLSSAAPDLQEHGSALVRVYTPVKVVQRPSGSTAVEGWNMAADAAMSDGADWLVLGADDIVWGPGWLAAALAAAEPGKAQVVGLNDGHTNLHHYGAHYMVTADFVNKHQGGYFIPPHYKSWWFDRETCEKADHLGLYVASWDAMAEHLHPEWKTAEMDDTYKMGYALHDADQKLYNKRKDAGWPVDWPVVEKVEATEKKPEVVKEKPAEDVVKEEPKKKPAESVKPVVKKKS